MRDFSRWGEWASLEALPYQSENWPDFLVLSHFHLPAILLMFLFKHQCKKLDCTTNIDCYKALNFRASMNYIFFWCWLSAQVTLKIFPADSGNNFHVTHLFWVSSIFETGIDSRSMVARWSKPKHVWLQKIELPISQSEILPQFL